MWVSTKRSGPVGTVEERSPGPPELDTADVKADPTEPMFQEEAPAQEVEAQIDDARGDNCSYYS